MNHKIDERWIFDIKIIRKPGVLNAVTGVFSSWGISLETAMLNNMGDEGTDGIIILSFACSKRKMEILERTVSRLSRVRDIKSYPYLTDQLRMFAACTVDADYVHATHDSLDIEELQHRDDLKMLYISGTLKDVDSYLNPMLKQKHIHDLVRTIITI